MKLTDGFCVSLRASFQPGRMGEICLISKASTMGGGTAPRKNCLQICTASEKLTLSADSKMAARNDTFVKPFFELLRKNITKKSSYHLIPDGRRIRQLNLLTLGRKGGHFSLCTLPGFLYPLTTAYMRLLKSGRELVIPFSTTVNPFRASSFSKVFQDTILHDVPATSILPDS